MLLKQKFCTAYTFFFSFSDFEEQLEMARVDETVVSDEQVPVEDSGGKAQNSVKRSKENTAQKLVDSHEKDKPTAENIATTTSDGDPDYPVMPKSSKFVNKSQNTDPDVFEFQDSPESVTEKKEMTNSVTIKHNGPYVFQSQELGQGGRDVNENVGTLGEASTT